MADTSPKPAHALPLPPPPPTDVLPPAELRRVLRLAGGGAAVAALGAAVGFVAGETGPGWDGTARLAAVLLSSLVAGAALSLRPDAPTVWLLAAVAFAANSLGFPAHWDSGRTLMHVFVGVALVGAALTAMPRLARRAVIVAFVAFHFSSLLVATTWPESTPWITNQLGQRFYLPFMQFTYLRNAYHFYSPEPGPASHLFFLLTYELDETDPATGKPKTVNEWVTLPRRDTQWKDPLGQTYYRRLSITENAVRVAPDPGTATDEGRQARKRREDVALGLLPGVRKIPHASPAYEPEYRWRMPPQADVTRFLLPSFARHVAAAYSSPGYRVVNVKVYRAEHRIVTTQYFVTQAMSPYHPTLYRIYFLGDFDAGGRLVDPQDPMLYWIIPVEPTAGRHDLGHPSPDQFTDMLTQHSGYEFPWSQLRP